MRIASIAEKVAPIIVAKSIGFKPSLNEEYFNGTFTPVFEFNTQK
jgi:hypothetical protein